MIRLFAIALIVAASFAACNTASAQCGPGGCRAPQAYRTPVRKAVAMTVGWGYDALDRLNAQRAARGLRPYRRDRALTLGAMHAAQHRAKHFISGHCNDFSFLPRGAIAPAAGCAAWPEGMGFGSCACYESWTYAGAASCKGADGRVYHHLFVR